MKQLKKSFFVFMIGLLFLNPVLVMAQASGVSGNPQYGGVQDSISNFLCTPSDPPDGKDVERCVNKLYRFGIAFGAIALVFFLVYAGYQYIVGGEAGKSSAKATFQNALIGMALLLGSYVLLGFINPNLLLFKTIQPPIFNTANLPSCQDVGFGQQCTLPNGASGTSVGSGQGVGAQPYCNPVKSVKAPGLCDHPAGMPGKAPFTWSNTDPALKTAVIALEKKVGKTYAEGSDTGLSQAYRPPEYGAHMRSIYEAYALMNGKTETWLHSHGQYCADKGIAYVTKADVDKYDAAAKAYVNQHFKDHFTNLNSPTTCLSDHGFGFAIDIHDTSIEAAAVSVGLCHNVPALPDMNADINHYVLKSRVPTGTKCTY